MKKFTRYFLSGSVILAGVIGLFVLSAHKGWLSPSETTLRTRYGLPNSQFVTIDGQSIHYVDEGRGLPIVLVHGSFGSLRMWGDWVTALKKSYRVIRFDRPPMGLSGADPKGHYDAAREVELIDKLTAKLGVGRFFLAATSSGGESAAAYAALHPDKIKGVILSNIAAGPIARHPTHYPLSFRLAVWADSYLGGWHTPAFWRGVFGLNYANPDKIPTSLVREWTDLNNRAQLFPRTPRPGANVSFARTPGDLAAIHAPALVLWSGRDLEIPLAVDGHQTLQRLGSTDKRLIVIGDCGHMMPLECGPQSAVAAKAFLDRIGSAGSAQGDGTR